MKKGSIICVITFSALVLVAMILFIVALAVGPTAILGPGSQAVGLAALTGGLGIVAILLSIVSGIGTFVSSIVCLVQSKALNQAKGLMKGATITGIVGGALGLTVLFVIPAAIVILVTFGLIIGAFVKAKRLGELA